jgi:RimJ/RimL family protein N-acetyltransferase
MQICQLTEDDVLDFLAWRYPPPYHIYNLEVDDPTDTVAYFLMAENGYFAVHDDADALVGFCCYGFEGQVPGGDYTLDALDVGIGMRPSLTGKGLGYEYLAAVLDYAMESYQPLRLRATVAAFNRRSQRVFQKHGFLWDSSFVANNAARREFIIWTKEMDHGSEPHP